MWLVHLQAGRNKSTLEDCLRSVADGVRIRKAGIRKLESMKSSPSARVFKLNNDMIASFRSDLAKGQQMESWLLGQLRWQKEFLTITRPLAKGDTTVRDRYWRHRHDFLAINRQGFRVLRDVNRDAVRQLFTLGVYASWSQTALDIRTVINNYYVRQKLNLSWIKNATSMFYQRRIRGR